MDRPVSGMTCCWVPVWGRWKDHQEDQGGVSGRGLEHLGSEDPNWVAVPEG